MSLDTFGFKNFIPRQHCKNKTYPFLSLAKVLIQGIVGVILFLLVCLIFFGGGWGKWIIKIQTDSTRHLNKREGALAIVIRLDMPLFTTETFK